MFLGATGWFTNLHFASSSFQIGEALACIRVAVCELYRELYLVRQPPTMVSGAAYTWMRTRWTRTLVCDRYLASLTARR